MLEYLLCSLVLNFWALGLTPNAILNYLFGIFTALVDFIFETKNYNKIFLKLH